ncbi:hypothetical protein [Dyadobacter aurulentus]|uniref:hypothetical protein n=1 Tax=Dyadobacter sp. UC 10 TaxID=2605428 RepID=UPI0011F2393B|nr:hypothetical protein [Dyadobacter sp. UC 10]KAA0991367.1 hypothetical protein FXO21_14955 [Dyadobacter sp. UC 10]
MKKTDKHIGKFFRDPLPEPEVPADDAWAGMNDMLHAAAGGTPVNGHAGKWFSGLLKFKGLILSSLILVSVTGFVIYKIADSPVATSDPVPALVRSEQPANPGKTLPDEAVSEKIEQFRATPEIPEPEIIIPDKNHNNPESEKSILTKKQNNPESITTDKKLPIPPKSPNQARRKPEVGESEENARSSTTLVEKVGMNKDHDVAGTQKILQNSSIAAAAQENAFNGFTPGTHSLRTGAALSSAEQFNIHSLKPLNVHFQTFTIDLGRRVIVQNLPKQPENQRSKSIRTFHLGLEWSLNSSLKSTNYIATGADSIPRIARLLIPGVFATKTWRKSSITVSYLPYQSYFGDNKLMRQEVDSTSTDSVKTYSNALFIKAVGMTFSAQYQYHVTRLIALNAGASYNIFTSALVRPQAQNWQGQLLDGQLATLKKSKEMSPYINPRLFTLKAGVAFTPGRFQAGLNVILPLSNVSKSSQFPVKALNGQVYLRYLVW